MEKNQRLSVAIITYNEEKNISDCLESVKEVADEIVVIDSFSTDRTEQICKEFGVRFKQNNFEGHIQQKNVAMRAAEHDYVLSLDADERLSKELIKSILAIKARGFSQDAYAFNRLNNYCGVWIKHSGWYPDRKIRLWNRKKGEWGGENPHDKVIMQDGTSTKRLNGDLLHFSYYSVSEHFKQVDYFTSIAAKAAYQKGKTSSFLGLWVRPLFNFVQNYLFRRGFMDGYYGFVICTINASANFQKYLKLRELNRGKLDL